MVLLPNVPRPPLILDAPRPIPILDVPRPIPILDDAPMLVPTVPVDWVVDTEDNDACGAAAEEVPTLEALVVVVVAAIVPFDDKREEPGFCVNKPADN